ncbi:MAG: T9SS type A sorting domain-containing protein [Flavobacteriales bacterium]|nr:T9SS type A sorting domain-containing protein [Flavobacteriales bacterium]
MMKKLLYLCLSIFPLLLLSQANLVLEQTNEGYHTASKSIKMTSGFKANPSDFQEEYNFHAKISDFTKAPNSYIFDVNNNSDKHGIFIPVTKAYEVWENEFGGTPLTNLSAYVLWEDVPGLIRPLSGGNPYQLQIDTTEGAGADARIRVEINKSKGEGNAVIALYGTTGTVDESTPVLWSWHVWVTDDPTVNSVTVSNGETYMDRNLGATNAEFLGHDWNKTGGLMYQWGRKDPFPPLKYKEESAYLVSGVIGIKRHTNFYTNDTNVTEWNKEVYNPSVTVNNNLEYSIENPDLFFTAPNNNANINWWGESNEKLWRTDLVKSTYDPCPDGYRIPKQPLLTGVNNSLLTSDYTVYPSLGVKYHLNQSQDILIPHSGKIYYESGKYYDNYSESFFQYSNGYVGATGQPVQIKMNSDAHNSNYNSSYGISEYGIQDIGVEGSSSYAGTACRCVVDEDNIVFNKTEYIDTSNVPSYEEYTTGLDNPNSYIVMTDEVTSFSFPLSKAYSVYNQYSTDHQMLSNTPRAVSIYWTDNQNLITNISKTSNGWRDGQMQLTLASGEHGNAIVALHETNDISSPVLWSWHIWAPVENPEQNTVTYTTEPVIPNAHSSLKNPTITGFPPLATEFMNMNLGALNAMPSDLPSEINSGTPNYTELIASIRASTGLHYQWGRKDPIPTAFMNKNPTSLLYPASINIYRQVLDSNNNVVWQPISVSEVLDWSLNPVQHNSQYRQLFSENFATYSNNAGVTNLDDAITGASKVLRYSIQNPLTFLYQEPNGCVGECTDFEDKSLDWLSDVDGLMPERWGHGKEKSPFDPCPNGWRVPDTSIGKIADDVSTGIWNGLGMRGNSPWYFGDREINLNNGLPTTGINQFRMNATTWYTNADDSYPNNTYPSRRIAAPKWLGEPSSFHSVYTYGWVFTHDDYGIGTIPASGIRGSDGGNDFKTSNGSVTYADYPDYGYRAGLWTSSPGSSTGYAMALELHGFFNGLSAGTIHNKMAAMNCRCVKDLPRYEGIVPANASRKRKDVSIVDSNINTVFDTQNVEIYPNPAEIYLKVSSDEKLDYTIYSLEGRLVAQGSVNNRTIDVKNIQSGVYMIYFTNKENGKEYLNKFIKR